MTDIPDNVSLQLLGRQMREMQAELHTIRDEAKLWQSLIGSEFVNFTTNIATAVGDRIAQFEARLEARLDQSARSIEEWLERIEKLLER
jgi:hypothetical protein